MKTYYYFVYGSNMSFKQMLDRCGCSNFSFLKRAYLKNYKFVYDSYSSDRRGAVANIVASKGDIIWGALYQINENCSKKLDYYEGHPTVYQRKLLTVIDDEGNEFEAYVYLRPVQEEGQFKKKANRQKNIETFLYKGQKIAVCQKIT